MLAPIKISSENVLITLHIKLFCTLNHKIKKTILSEKASLEESEYNKTYNNYYKYYYKKTKVSDICIRLNSNFCKGKLTFS